MRHGESTCLGIGVARWRSGGAGAVVSGLDGFGRAAKRARIVLLAAEGVRKRADHRAGGHPASDRDVVARPLPAQRIAGLAEVRRPGRPRVIDQAAIVTATLTPPPKKLGVTHWSTRLLAKRLGLSDYTVAPRLGDGERADLEPCGQ